MPKIIKKKTVKKKVVQEDEVKGFALDAFDAIKKRQKKVIIAAVIVFAIAALYAAFSMYSSSVRGDAVDAEMKANDYYYGESVAGSMSDEDRLHKALELFRKSVDIKMTRTALYNLGNTYYRMGDYGNAIKQYDLFVDKFSDNKEMLPLVYQKMAASYLRTGQKDKAFETLAKLSKAGGGIFRDTALVLEARYLENAGEAEKSLEKYRELAAGYPSSIWSAEAASKFPAPKDVKAGEAGAADDKGKGKQD